MARPTALDVLSALIGLDRQIIELALSETESYQKIEIPKRNNGRRIIHIPSEILALVQKYLLECLYSWEVHDYMHGCVIGRSPVSNAAKHLRLNKKENVRPGTGEQFLYMTVPRHVLKLDLSNAFHAVTKDAVHQMLTSALSSTWAANLHLKQGDTDVEKKRWDIINHVRSNGYFVEPLASLITQLTTTEGLLPQGAATSPYLLNMVICASGLMERVAKACKPRRGRFTVYVDDITISTKEPEIGEGFIAAMIEAVERGGRFTVNPKKTSLTDSRHRAPVITGVTLGTNADGTGRLSIEQSHLNTIRRILWCAANLLEQGIKPDFDEHGFSLDHALGHAAWVDNVYQDKAPHPLVAKPLARFRKAFLCRALGPLGTQLSLPFGEEQPKQGLRSSNRRQLLQELLDQLLDRPVEERIRAIDEFNTQH
ncbi:MAG: hypothetical protein KBB55_02840 [Candidatus Buchananbacteria bacterium]|nr:hypothetical protein [Candidatus Buchananbacteria bacterium]